ncbi:MAG TPA: carbohydrate-binding protein, partial [Polyangiaceae bacterium]|nr:carbohydrate-binding protein [Polyangiaceae bacterium]
MKTSYLWILAALGSLMGCGSGQELSNREDTGELTNALVTSVSPSPGLRRVLVLSIDGMHAVDLYKWVTNNPRSNIARLYQHGVDYPNATTTTPSGGLPGMLALATGGTPRTTGVYHEDSYDRTLYPPGSNCVGGVGTEVVYDASVAQDSTLLMSAIEPTNLPLRVNSQGACVPVYPHEFLRASTVFEAVQGSGRRTSWTDNHAAYEILKGPSGNGLSEFFPLEVGSLVVNGGTVNGVNLSNSSLLCNATNSITTVLDYTNCLPAAQAYDDVKVQSLINKIDGFTADGARQAAVPTLLGMNFVAVEVAQKLPMGGYVDAIGNPSSLLLKAFQRVDLSIGRILTELNTKHLIEKTLVVLTAKHGQAPIDKDLLWTEVSGPGGIPGVINPLALVQTADPNVDSVFASFVNPNNGRSPAVNGHVQTGGDVGLVWLQDQNNVNVSNVVQVLSDPLNGEAMGATERPQGSIFSANIASGTELSETYGDPQSSDALAAARAPNVLVQPNAGVVYSSGPFIADHGGGAIEDINVPLLVSNTAIARHLSIYEPVSTTQVAPTILKALALNGVKLTAAIKEQTNTLPGISWGAGQYQAGSTIKAVDYDSQTNTQTDGTAPPFVSYFDSGSSICFDDVSLDNVVAIQATLASENANGTFSIRINGPNGTQIGSYAVQPTGGWTNWSTVTIPITATTGTHTLCFRGESSSGIANLLSFYLVGTCIPECTGAACGSDGCGGTCGACAFNFICDDPYAQCVVPPTRYSLVDPALPYVIPAPAYDVQTGTTPGGDGSVGAFDANDYLCYYGVDLTSVVSLVTSFGAANAGGVFSIRIDSPTGTQIGSYTVPSTGGATNWVSKRVALTTPVAGVHAVCIRGQSGTSIARFRSFELSSLPVLPKGTVGSTVSAVPPDLQQGTTIEAPGHVANFDANDYFCYDDIDLTGVNSISVNVASSNGGGAVSVRVGSPTGTQIGSFTMPNTGGWTNWVDMNVGISSSPGMKTLCFFGVSGNGIGNLRTFTLSATPVTAHYALGSTFPAAPPDQLQGVTSSGGIISNFDGSDWFCYQQVDLTGVKAVVLRAGSANNGGQISVRIGIPAGLQIGSYTAWNTGGWSNWQDYRIGISSTATTDTLC